MALPLTTTAEQLLQKNEITPNLVLEIDGIDTILGAVTILEFWRIGDPGRDVGDIGLTIGGQVAIDDQETLISWTGGTSNTINQVLNPDKATNESISTIKIALVDFGQKATKLLQPGNEVEDVLGRRAIIWSGEAGGSWRDDYVIVFRGVIDDIDLKSGIVTLNVGSPDALKNRTTFLPGETDLTAGISDVDTVLNVTDTSTFLSPYTGPDLTVDTSLKLYVRIDDEIIQYEAVAGTTFTSLTRGALGTTAAAHSSGATVSSFYRFTGNAIDLALKFMLSGQDGAYIDDFPVKSFQVITALLNVPNAIFLADFDIDRVRNINVGDYVDVTGATNGANNFTGRQITEIVDSDVGIYIVVDGASLVDEDPTSATIDITSQYDTWGPGAGLGMKPEDVDIAEHLDIKTKFLSSAEYDFYIREEIDNGKEFLSEQIYNPLSAYSLPRKAQASVAYNIGPIPGQEIKTLNASNTTNASKISIKRTTNKNFFNTIIYKFEEDELEERFKRGQVFISSDSVSRIPVGNKALIIEARGLRAALSAINNAQIASNRRLSRYEFGAESIKNIETTFSVGFNVEISDKIILDMTGLQISDINTGTRAGEARVVEVINKRLNLRNGKVQFDLLDTNFNLQQRFGLIAPSSCISTGASGTEFTIKPTFNTTRFGASEWRKWQRFTGSEVIVRSPDFTVSGTALLNQVTSNNITVQTDLGFTPLSGYIMEPSNYSDQTGDVIVVYGSMSDGDNDFADGKKPFTQS